jgi:hypothetical protein
MSSRINSRLLLRVTSVYNVFRTIPELFYCGSFIVLCMLLLIFRYVEFAFELHLFSSHLAIEIFCCIFDDILWLITKDLKILNKPVKDSLLERNRVKSPENLLELGISTNISKPFQNSYINKYKS